MLGAPVIWQRNPNLLNEQGKFWSDSVICLQAWKTISCKSSVHAIALPADSFVSDVRVLGLLISAGHHPAYVKSSKIVNARPAWHNDCLDRVPAGDRRNLK